MAKAIVISEDTLEKAITPPRSAIKSDLQDKKPMEEISIKKNEKESHIPLQVRLPAKEVKAIKLAAVESDKTISDFMLACFHAYMKGGKHE
jgi:hypothetical protein